MRMSSVVSDSTASSQVTKFKDLEFSESSSQLANPPSIMPVQKRRREAALFAKHVHKVPSPDSTASSQVTKFKDLELSESSSQLANPPSIMPVQKRRREAALFAKHVHKVPSPH